MKVSRNWLQRHVDLTGIPGRKIMDDLTLSTAEVEGLEERGAALAPLRVGLVVERSRHANADKLSLCKVDVGEGQLLPIVCGAANVAQGQKVVVALPGTVMPGGQKIEQTRIRGELSCGMICSERELGLSDEHAGILVLPAEARVGAPLLDTLPLRDEVFEFDNKSVGHRPDLWGHYGVARELAAMYGRPLRPYVAAPALPATGTTVPITVAAPDRCQRYLGLVCEGVRVGPSPAWLRYLLNAVGQRPINNVVDLTNFVLLDLGQPQHAFDLDRLRGPRIDVRLAQDGETLRTLDGQARTLTREDLVIADGGGAVAIAGVMGGGESEVSAGTTRILLESAHFAAASVRRTTVRQGLRTEASTRYEKSLDPEHARLGLLRFVELLPELSPGARAAGPVVAAGTFQPQPRTIVLRKARLARKLGLELPAAKVTAIFTALELGVQETAEAFQVAIPSFRAGKDLALEDDLIEEVGRMFRYDNIPPRPSLQPVVSPYRDPELALMRRVKEVCAFHLGLHEAYNYSFVPDALIRALGDDPTQYAEVRNPVAPDICRVRREVLPSLLANLEVNLRHHAEVRLFEVGKGYRPEVRTGKLPGEVHQLALLVARRAGADPLAELRGALALLLTRVERSGEFVAFRGAPRPWVHPGRSLSLLAGERELGHACTVHPELLRRLGLRAQVAAAVVDLRALLAVPARPATYRALPRFPAQPVDVALVVAESARVADVAAWLKQLDDSLVHSVTLFEVYRGKGIPDGRKSLNFTVSLASADRTLTREDEERYLTRVRTAAAGIQAELRG